MKADILVLDDEESIRFSFYWILSAEGYNVITAETYRDALSRMDEMTFDLIIADTILEDGWGTDILREVMDRKIDTRVIIMTACPSLQRVHDCFRMNAADYLVKPIRHKKLIHSVEMLFQDIRNNKTDKRIDN